ncbi:MAG: ribosome maturation factor RimM, partial [Deltaproteobacteria bacterium]|nr:ribosome maturation factor RimM [Deltaproteobacteria bacterium]
KAHGIKGELCIEYNAESLDLLGDFIYLSASTENNKKKYKIRGLRLHHDRPLLLLEGLTDRAEAEHLRNFLIFVPAQRLPQLAPEEIYLHELPGFNVFIHSNEKENQPLGRIDSIQDAAGQELWVIITPDGREVLFPATDEFVQSIDLDKKVAVINPPPGLLELYLEQT